jgi:CRISPR system Cascade subunit CasB
MSEPSESIPTDKTWTESFVTYLEELRDRQDRGALAAMRRWLDGSARSSVEAMRVVQPRLSMTNVHTRETREDVSLLVGALFALHDAPGGSGNLGDAFRRLGGSGEPPPNVERRFMTLLACDEDEIDAVLRQAVMLLKSGSVPINWHQTFRDLMSWKGRDPQKRELVRRRWARSFWRSRSQSENDSHSEN